MTIDKVAWLKLTDGRILTARSRGRTTYYLPGGKREPGESDLDTLVREVLEELAVTIDPTTATHEGTFTAEAHARPQGTTIHMTCYSAQHTGTPTPTSEIEEIRWLTYENRDQVSPVTQAIFDHLHKNGRII